MNEIDIAKSAWDRAQRAISNKLLDLTPFQGEVRHPSRNLPAWQDLYYAQPNTSQAEKALSVRLAALVSQCPEIAAQVAPLVQSAIDCAKAVLAAKAAPKQPRKRAGALQYGSAFRGSWAAQPVAPQAINPGDYLVVRYGDGHQLVYVDRISGPVGLVIYRLKCRGYTYACWVKSWISREDGRILGLGRPHPADPKLPV